MPAKNIILAVTGSIAAYKSIEILRLLVKSQNPVIVVLSSNALKFVQPLAFLALGALDVRTQLMDDQAEAAMSHIELARWADILLVAPASANTIGKMANGLADDLLTTLYLATSAQTIVAPAMNSVMWQHQAMLNNASVLQNNAVHFIQPSEGELACGEIGKGKLADVETIVNAVNDFAVVENKQPNEVTLKRGIFVDPLLLQKLAGCLDGLNIVITAGPTQEPIDPVRYISNHSSGRMGFALAQAAKILGAKVTLITGPVQLQKVNDVTMIKVTTAAEMFEAVKNTVNKCDVFIASAAVADYHCEKIADQKIKKSADQITLTLKRNPDIVAYVANIKKPPFVVGFAAETENLHDNARLKLQNKNLNMVIANLVGVAESGFNSVNNTVSVIDKNQQVDIKNKAKTALAYDILELVSKALFKD